MQIPINKNIIWLLLFGALILLFFGIRSCDLKEETKTKIVEPYDGPLAEAENVVTLFSDSSIVRVEMRAPVQYELQNHDREFPKGVDIDFFTIDGEVETTLTSNYGKYTAETGVYHAKGHVVILNTAKNEKLESEELFWDPATEKIYTPTNVQVRIVTPNETLWGNGLEAKQDFSSYKILDPVGVIAHEH